MLFRSEAISADVVAVAGVVEAFPADAVDAAGVVEVVSTDVVAAAGVVGVVCADVAAVDAEGIVEVIFWTSRPPPLQESSKQSPRKSPPQHKWPSQMSSPSPSLLKCFKAVPADVAAAAGAAENAKAASERVAVAAANAVALPFRDVAGTTKGNNVISVNAFATSTTVDKTISETLPPPK